MKNINFLIGATFLIFFTLFISSALEINSTNYSGYLTQGSSGGNITNSNYNGDSSSFYQQAIGQINSLIFSGIHGFSFAVSELTSFVPLLSIAKPENKTYITTINLPLNFTVSLQNYIWYNLDNGANQTIIGNTTFNTTNGQHTLYLFANNTYGNSSANITFITNTTRFAISYNNYSGSTRASSTDFNKSTYEELQNLSGVVLENTNFGKIMFNQAINLTNDITPTDNMLNLDLYTNISDNNIEVNSTILPNFNKPSTIYLYNLTFTNPRILRDGSVCSSSICTEINYSGGTFIFNVTQFSTYSAEETPSGQGETPSSSGGSGGSGGGGVSLFSLDKEQISVTLNPGQVKTEEIIITNTGISILDIKIDNLFTDFVVRGEDFVILNPGESRAIPLHILARIDTIPDLYLGKVILTSGSIKKEILIAVEVESEGALLDVRAEIQNKQILRGEEILSEIRLFNFGGEGRKDVFIDYIIKDYDGNEIAIESESLAIETQITFLKRISVPEGISLGKYILYVKVDYEGKIASASDNFEIVSSIVTFREKLYIVIIIILSILLSLMIYWMIVHRMNQHGKIKAGNRKRVDLKSLMK